MRPDLRVALAAYGDYGAGYIGTLKAYAEGGYETAPGFSRNHAVGGPPPSRRLTAWEVREGHSPGQFWFTIQ